jgi:hypothetical protein
MHARGLTGVIALCTYTAVAAAHAQTSTSTDMTNASNNSVTVQGCVERSPISAMPSATPGSTSSTPASYLLTNIAKPSGPAVETAPSPGVAPKADNASGHLATSYRLDVDDNTLSAHVGHQVEITGMVEDEVASHTSPSGSSSPATSTTMSAPRLKVQHLKMLAASCTAG